MAKNGEQTGPVSFKELLGAERSVLRALCLTVNLSGSIVKDKILESVSRDDFHFPITRAIFSVLADLDQRGEYVVLTNLESALHSLQVGIPEDVFLEDLFRGDPPRPAEVTVWLDRMKGRAASEKAPVTEGAVADKLEAATVSPTLPRRTVEPAGPGVESGIKRPRPAPEARRAGRAAPAEAKAPAPPVDAGEGAPQVSRLPALASEADEWTEYLRQLGARQGKVFETGFTALDDAAGGLLPGLLVVVDQESGRLSAFLKQLTDQVAAGTKVPCLYLSWHVPKRSLRLRTLARLSGVAAMDLERGRLRKGSPEWESVERSGREAAEWLRWVYIVEADPKMEAEQIQEMARQLLEISGAATCLITLDSLEGMGRPGETPQATLGALRSLAKSLEALVVTGTSAQNLSLERGDFSAVLNQGQGAWLQLDLLRAEDSRSAGLRLQYQPDICRFVEYAGT